MSEEMELWSEEPEGDTAEETKQCRDARIHTVKIARGLQAAIEHVLEGVEGCFPCDDKHPMYAALALTKARLSGLREALETLHLEVRHE
jgi:hypothetical protein